MKIVKAKTKKKKLNENIISICDKKDPILNLLKPLLIK